MNHTHRINMNVFGRFLHGKKKGQVNPKSVASLSLFVKDSESVTDRLNRFKAECIDAPIFKITKIEALA